LEKFKELVGILYKILRKLGETVSRIKTASLPYKTRAILGEGSKNDRERVK